MMSKIHFTSLAALILPGLCAAQTPAIPLTLEDCIRLAQDAPSVITAARRDVDYSQLSYNQARHAFLPTGTLTTGYNYNTPSAANPGTFAFVALNAIHEYVGHGNVTMQLDTSGQLRAAVDRARADQAAASASLTIAKRDLRRLVTIAYYQVLLQRRLVTVAADVLREAESFEKRVQLLEEGGEVARADVVQAASQVSFYEQALSNAELQAQLANMDLASYWTTDVTTRLPLVDTFDEPPRITDAGGLGPDPYLDRPEFSLLDAQKRGLEADARAVRAQLKPQTSITWQYGVDMNRVNFNEHGTAAFFSVTVPVFDWFRTRDLSDQSRLRAAQVENQARIAERTYSRDYQNALARLNTMFQQVAITQRQTDIAQESLRITQLKYQGGEGLPIEVLSAQTQVGQARTNYFTAIANYYVAKSDLEVAAGR